MSSSEPHVECLFISGCLTKSRILQGEYAIGNHLTWDKTAGDYQTGDQLI